jgi:Cu/Ag efflux protein CusF
MKKLLVSAVAAFAVMGATFAFAADATGNITKIDAPTRAVTLADGKIYTFPASVDITKLKVGDKVKVTFTTDTAGKNNATAVAAAS